MYFDYIYVDRAFKIRKKPPKKKKKQKPPILEHALIRYLKVWL